MRNVYLSFLGAGDYTKIKYTIDNKSTGESKYVQSAELQLRGADSFDAVYIVMTPTSREKHFESLKDELLAQGVDNVREISISESLESRDQWSWFESILEQMQFRDNLTVDLTHGYRIAPIVLSTAINFLQKIKQVSIDSVYYGAFENSENGVAPIIDLKAFYIINEWADAVTRLVDDADPSKMSQVAQKDHSFLFDEFKDDAMLIALDELSSTLKNVDIHNVRGCTEKVLGSVNHNILSSSLTGKILLEMVRDKFAQLVVGASQIERYTHSYFKGQLQVIKLLLEHHLFMQAYTVMREFIGSLGLIEMKPRAKISNGVGRKQRQKADVFVNMLQHDEAGWQFEGKEGLLKSVKPVYQKLKNVGVESQLRNITCEIIQYRNGFDHAWTASSGAKEDVEEKGRLFFHELEKVIALMNKHDLFEPNFPPPGADS